MDYPQKNKQLLIDTCCDMIKYRDKFFHLYVGTRDTNLSLSHKHLSFLFFFKQVKNNILACITGMNNI